MRNLFKVLYIYYNHDVVKRKEEKNGRKMKREKFSCKSHWLQATESPSVSSGLVWTAPLCTWIYYAIHVRVYINCYVERARALYHCMYIHIHMYLSAEPWLSREEYFRRAFIQHCRERSSWNDMIKIKNCNIYD